MITEQEARKKWQEKFKCSKFITRHNQYYPSDPIGEDDFIEMLKAVGLIKDKFKEDFEEYYRYHRTKWDNDIALSSKEIGYKIACWGRDYKKWN